MIDRSLRPSSLGQRLAFASFAARLVLLATAGWSDQLSGTATVGGTSFTSKGPSTYADAFVWNRGPG